MQTAHQDPNQIRAEFSRAMSAMYRDEVPAYGTLIDIVSRTNEAVLSSPAAADLNLTPEEDTDRISEERHGAIRLGTAEELAMMARVFAVMGMEPVGYYDLSVASVPVHSTAFRPVRREDLARNPFRVFTSLLRLELIEDEALRQTAKDALSRRQIFTEGAIALTEKAEKEGGLNWDDATLFVAEVLETFRWHQKACLPHDVFEALNNTHRLIADIVSFRGPHINHLTPRTLDIDAAQIAMQNEGLPAKAVIEGPPRRRCPILLRQTSFKALEEKVLFPNENDEWMEGSHTARFGEIEQRGVALTPKGRALYDRLLAEVRESIQPAADGSNADEYEKALSETFSVFPDDWRRLFDEGLAYFKFSVEAASAEPIDDDIAELLDAGVLSLSPLIYEDFLPVSAAGIFQSNLDGSENTLQQPASSKPAFERALGRAVIDEFEQYEALQLASLEACLTQLRTSGAVA